MPSKQMEPNRYTTHFIPSTHYWQRDVPCGDLFRILDSAYPALAVSEFGFGGSVALDPCRLTIAIRAGPLPLVSDPGSAILTKTAICSMYLYSCSSSATMRG